MSPDLGPTATHMRRDSPVGALQGWETDVMSVAVLDREMFTEAAAARLLGVPQRTLNYWLEGGERRGRLYKPVIRVEPKGGHPPVTWAEFIESGLLREYRKVHVPMAELRAFIDLVRERYQVPYPLADRRPWVSGQELLSQAQDTSGLDAEFCLIAEVRGQYVLTAAADSPVRMQPETRFGRPAVSGISTEVVWEHEQAGEIPDEIAAEFGLSDEDVRWALPYETSARAQAA